MSLASASGCVEVVKVLLEFGAQVDLPNDVRECHRFVIVALDVHGMCHSMTREALLYLLHVHMDTLKQPGYY